MSNWRTTLKTFFADLTVTALGGDLTAFGAWNSQIDNNTSEETFGPLAVFFEYSSVGNGLEYLKQTNVQQAERVPVEVTLHIVFNTYNEQSQDLAYEYAEKITCSISGRKHEMIHGVILKTSEIEDTNRNAQYEYQISFVFQLKEVVFNNVLEAETDANPITTVDPEPTTGRRLKTDIVGAILSEG